LKDTSFARIAKAQLNLFGFTVITSALNAKMLLSAAAGNLKQRTSEMVKW